MRTIKLETTDCDVLFYLKQHKFKTQLTVSVEIISKSEQNPITIRSVETSVSKKNLYDLTIYIENHVNSLKTEPHTTSHSYADSDVLYSIQGFGGNYDEERDTSYFSLRLFVNTGSPPESRNRIYFGADMFTNSQTVSKFISDMRQAIAHIDAMGSSDA